MWCICNWWLSVTHMLTDTRSELVYTAVLQCANYVGLEIASKFVKM